VALAELSVPHEVITFDLKGDAHKQPNYLKLNPNGTVPTLVVDGVALFESVAILVWLGETFGAEKNLWPAPGDSARLSALSWLGWTYGTLSPYVGHHRLGSGVLPSADALAAHGREGLAKCYAILDSQLSKNAHLLGKNFSLVDSVVSNAVQYATICGVPPANFPHLAEWLARCVKRPAFADEWKAPSAA
jgi:glutathione S-transferase